jgi:molecular chaperone GrpE
MSNADDVATPSDVAGDEHDPISIDVEVVDAEVVAEDAVDRTLHADRPVDAARVAKAYDTDTKQSSGGVKNVGHAAPDAVADADSPSIDVDADVDAAQVEGDIDAIAVAIAERDEYLAALQQLKADFDNYRKRILKQTAEAATIGQEKLVEKLLPTLDTLELAVAHGESGVVESVAVQLLDVLSKEGLERIHPNGQPFDPALHEAVAHDEGEPGQTGSVVSEVFRTGYRYNNRVLRPAMVKVRG